MEPRRVVRIGGSYYVALPKGWVSENVGEGGFVALRVEEDGSLRLSPLRDRRGEVARSIRLTCREDLHRNIVSAYLKGFEVIEVAFGEECRGEVIRVVERARQLLVGLELVGEEPGTVTLQCFIRPDYDLESVLQRMNSITLAMLRLAFEAARSGNVGAAEKAVSMDDLVDRLYFLAVRIIRSRVADPAYPSREKVRLVDLRLIARNIEGLGDLYERLALSGASAGLDWRLYELLAGLQRAVISLVLEGGVSRTEVLQAYRSLEAVLEKSRGFMPARAVEILESAAATLRDTMDLT